MEKKSSLFIIVIYLLLYYKLCNAKKTRTHIESQTHIWASVCTLRCWYSTIECGKVMLNGRRRSQQLCAQFCVQSKTKLLRLRWFCFSAIGIVYAEKYFKTVFLLLLLSDAILHSYNSYFLFCLQRRLFADPQTMHAACFLTFTDDFACAFWRHSCNL